MTTWTMLVSNCIYLLYLLDMTVAHSKFIFSTFYYTLMLENTFIKFILLSVILLISRYIQLSKYAMTTAREVNARTREPIDIAEKKTIFR